MKQRVNDLVSRLKTQKIMYQMAKGGGGKYGGSTSAIARLGRDPINGTQNV